jgi:anti-sigma factor RsiW
MHSRVEDLRRYALGQLPANEAAAIETHLMECLSCGKAFAELTSGPKDLPLEQRREVRVTLDSPARIKALDPLTSLGPSAAAQFHTPN